jgi:hypothetical protein
MRPIAACLALSVLMAIWPRLTTQAQGTLGMTSVQIVNATSVPVLALKVNDNLAYNTFPQGKRSGDAPVPLLEAVYEAEDKRSGSKAKSDKIIYERGTYQSLVILGDFSTSSPARILRQPDDALNNEDGKHLPNVLFQVYPHTPSKAPVRLRIINGVPGKRLTFASGNHELVIQPGDCGVLENQPATAQYTGHVDGESVPLFMRQEGLIRNAIIVFFLKDGKPSFMRAFENNAESKAMRAELKKARE